MTLSEAGALVCKALRGKLMVEVDYMPGEAGAETCRKIRPFAIRPGNQAGRPPKFVGWCLSHAQFEQKDIASIRSIIITNQHFDSETREPVRL